MTALMLASQRGHTEVVLLLVKAKALIDIQTVRFIFCLALYIV